MGAPDARMNNDFGLLVDYLRGELDGRAAAAVRSRLEAEGELFEAFVRLRRTFAVLRSMPALGNVDAPARAAYLSDLQREFETRGWADMLPALMPSPEFLALLRTEYTVRALLSCIPQLVPGPQFVAALRARLGTQGVVSQLPQLAVRAQWVRALRHEFVVRATLETLPQLEPAAAWRRRVQLAVFEAARETEPAPAPLLPAMAAQDSFRRRLFRSLLHAASPKVGGRAFRFDLREYQFGRVLAGAWKRSRKPVAVTLTLHALAVALLFFVTAAAWTTPPAVALAAFDGSVPLTPQQPGGEFGPSVHLPVVDRGMARRTPDRPVPPDNLVPSGDEPGVPPELPADEITAPRATATLPEQPVRTATMAWFRLRPEGKNEKIRYLGSSELYEALERALLWLRRWQSPDGSWPVTGAANAPVDPALQQIQQIEITSAALLAFLGDGHNSRHSMPGLDYNLNVRRGIDWLLRQQLPDGRIGPQGEPIVLAHAMATLALAEEFSMTRDWRVGTPLRNACRWLSSITAHDGSSGFPYRAGRNASLMTSVWAHMALATAIRAGVPQSDAPPERLEALMAWFGSQTRYDTPLTDAASEVLAQSELLPTSGAAALACLQEEPELKPRLESWLARMGKEPPTLETRAGDARDVRYMFLGSLALANHASDAAGEKWKAAMAATILSRQVKGERDANEGAFESTSTYADIYGRAFSTAFTALSIENAWRVRVK